MHGGRGHEKVESMLSVDLTQSNGTKTETKHEKGKYGFFFKTQQSHKQGMEKANVAKAVLGKGSMTRGR